MKGEYIILRDDVKETLASDLKLRKLKLTFKEDNSSSDSINTITNVQYNEVWRRNYGESSVRFDNENSTAIEELEVEFSPTPIINNNILDNTLLNYPTSSLNGKDPKSNTRILIENTVPCNFPIGYNIDPTTGISRDFLNLNQYETATHWNDPYSPTFDLNFGVSNEYYFIPDTEFTENNLTNNYWLGTIREINESKIITIKMWMSDLAISTLKMNTKFYLQINDYAEYFIINQLKEWDGKTNIATLELITYNSDDYISNPKNISLNTTINSTGRGTTRDNIESGRNVEIIGNKNEVRGDNITVRGDLNNVNGDFNTVIGRNNTVNGFNNNSNGDYSFLIGNVNINYGDYNNIEGNNNKVEGNNNTVNGNNIIVKGDNIWASKDGYEYYNQYIVDNKGLISNPGNYIVDLSLLFVQNNYVEFNYSPDNLWDITIDWGDGEITSISGGTGPNIVFGRTYEETGRYEISIKGNLPGLWLSNSSITSLSIIGINRFGEITNDVSMDGRYAEIRNLKEFRASDGHLLLNKTSMVNTFIECDSLSVIDVSTWRTDNMIDMTNCFMDLNMGNTVSFIGIENLNLENVQDFTGFLSGTPIEDTDYETLWSNLSGNVETGVTFDAENKLENGSPGWLVRDDKINNQSWIVTDGGDF